MSQKPVIKNQKLELAKLVYFAAQYRLFLTFFQQPHEQAIRNAELEAECITIENMDADMLAIGFVYDISKQVWIETEIEWENEETHHDN